jgi:hypothetical protein
MEFITLSDGANFAKSETGDAFCHPEALTLEPEAGAATTRFVEAWPDLGLACDVHHSLNLLSYLNYSCSILGGTASARPAGGEFNFRKLLIACGPQQRLVHTSRKAEGFGLPRRGSALEECLCCSGPAIGPISFGWKNVNSLEVRVRS